MAAARGRSPVRTKVLGLVLASLGMGGLIAVGVMLASDREGTAFAVGAGVLGSLIASLYALLVNVFVLGDTSLDADRLEQVVGDLTRGAALLEQGAAHGVVAVKPKSAYTRDEWVALLTGAHKELVIVGHALHKWCRDDVKPPFVEAIQRLAGSGHRVLLVVLPLDGNVTEQLGQRRGKDYRRRVKETLETLAEIHSQLPEPSRRLLEVRMLRDDTPMPYMLAGNDQVLVTAPYPIAADSDTMPAVTVDATSPLGAALRDDLRRLVGTYSERVELGQGGGHVAG